MVVTTFSNASSFLAQVETFLLEAEIENALILGMAHAYTRLQNPPPITPYFACVADAEGIVLCAHRTYPGRLAVTNSRRPGGLGLLAEDALGACPDVCEVVGVEPTVSAIAEVLAARMGRTAERRMSQRLHALERVDAFATAPGRLRPAREADLDVLAEWAEAFCRDIGEPAASGEARQMVDTRIRSESLFVWERDTPVSMAASAGKTPNGVRVNLVYTPPELRGQGYATACVAAVSQLLLQRGNRFCCLYTDLANGTSNAIYHRIGYRPVCDAGWFVLRD